MGGFSERLSRVSVTPLLYYHHCTLTLKPVRFIDFGSLPCFVALSELASTEARRQVLRKGYAQYVQLYAKDLELPGPYLRARLSNDLNENLRASLMVGGGGGYININFPFSEFMMSIIGRRKRQLTLNQVILVNGTLSLLVWVAYDLSSHRNLYQVR